MSKKDTNDRIQYWLDIAQYDLETAKAMLETKRYLYVGFMCHQAIEKILKAVYIDKKDKVPPYSHNLNYLATESGIITLFSDKQLDFLDELQPLNIEARYPTLKEQMHKKMSGKKCNEILEKTKALYAWLKKQL